jgi:hypothetical protein
VNDEHERRLALDVAGEQEIDDPPSGLLVEIAGRLAGGEPRRIMRQPLAWAAKSEQRQQTSHTRRQRPAAFSPYAMSRVRAEKMCSGVCAFPPQGDI